MRRESTGAFGRPQGWKCRPAQPIKAATEEIFRKLPPGEQQPEARETPSFDLVVQPKRGAARLPFRKLEQQVHGAVEQFRSTRRHDGKGRYRSGKKQETKAATVDPGASLEVR